MRKGKSGKYIIAVLTFIILVIGSGCSIEPIGTLTGEESPFDKTINSKEDSNEKDLTSDSEEVVVTYDQVDYNSDEAIVQTTEAKEIKGYFEGEYFAQIVTTKKSSVIFIDDKTGEHLDLLEIAHGEDEWLSDVSVSDDFHRIDYELTSATQSKGFVHDLTQNTTFAVEAYSEPLSETMDQTVYDKVIANGVVMNPGDESYKFGYDIGIMDNKIVKITDQTLEGKEIIDASGLMVSPGFIDVLTFNMTDIGAKYKILDGVTSGLSIHGCTDDFDAFFAQYNRYGCYINYGGAVFAVRLRWEEGLGNFGVPTEEQIEHMAQRAREEIEAGGIALAFSPEYYPGTTSEEIKALMAVAAEYDIPTHFHARYSAISGEHTGIEGVEEVIAYAKELNAKVQFMHLHSTGGTGVMDEALAMINQARDQGYEVDYDIYPYDSWASRIEWERYREGWQERYGITYSDLQMAGTSVRLTEKTFNEYREGEGGLCIAFAMDEGEMLAALSEPYAMVGSDGCIEEESGGNDHFRGAGTFSRILGKYVRDENAFSLMDGVKKMTYNSAKHFEDFSEAMALRGRLEEGCIADITIFDYKSIIDMSTPQAPATPSEGIYYVLVNGEIGVSEGELVKSVRAGQPIASDYREDN